MDASRPLRFTVSPRLWRQLAAAILVAGLCLAFGIYWTAERRAAPRNAESQGDGDGSDGSLSPEDSKVFVLDSQINMGRPAMLIEQGIGEVAGLFHGKPLAFLVGGASLIGAGGCFIAASRRGAR